MIHQVLRRQLLASLPCLRTVAPSGCQQFKRPSRSTFTSVPAQPRHMEGRSGHMTMQELEAEIGQLSTAPMAPPPKPVVLIVSGPSGVGKDSVVARLRELKPEMHFVVTATSRPMREGERDGVDYHFVSKKTFEDWIAAGELLEHAVVYGQYKGIPRAQVADALARGCDVLLRLDVQGTATVKSLMPDVATAYIVAGSEAELLGRLVARQTETREALIKRALTLREENKRIPDFKYVVVNEQGNVDKAARQLAAIVDAERIRQDRVTPAQAAASAL